MANQTIPFLPLQSRPKYRLVYVKAGSTAPEAGQWLVQNTGGDAEYAVLPSNGASNAQNWVGVVAQILDAVTASVDGLYLVYDAEHCSFRGQATTSGNLAKSILNTKVTLDVTSSDQTVDENDTTNGVLFVENFDADKGTIDISVDPDNIARAA